MQCYYLCIKYMLIKDVLDDAHSLQIRIGLAEQKLCAIDILY